jgi:uncharacterized membrane protein
VAFILTIPLLLILARCIAPGKTLLWAIPLSFFIIPIHVRHNTLDSSTHDVIPTFFALAYLLFLFHNRSRPRIAALLLGISISIKLAPGIFYAPILLVPSYRRGLPYLFLPIALAFALPAAWEFQGFLNNILLWYFFTMDTDSTALAHFLSPNIRVVLKMFGLLIIFRMLWLMRSKEWSVDSQLQFLLISHAAPMIVGNYFHNNYLVWLLPIIGLVLLRALNNCVVKQPTSATQTLGFRVF